MSMSRMKIRAIRIVLCVVLLTAPGMFIASPMASAAGLACTAHVSPVHPTDYSDVTVTIHSRAGARITTIAHYRTTNHLKTGVANSVGSAWVVYWISGATIGFPVVITVVARIGTLSGSCRTSFTPV